LAERERQKEAVSGAAWAHAPLQFLKAMLAASNAPCPILTEISMLPCSPACECPLRPNRVGQPVMCPWYQALLPSQLSIRTSSPRLGP